MVQEMYTYIQIPPNKDNIDCITQQKFMDSLSSRGKIANRIPIPMI